MRMNRLQAVIVNNILALLGTLTEDLAAIKKMRRRPTADELLSIRRSSTVLKNSVDFITLELAAENGRPGGPRTRPRRAKPVSETLNGGPNDGLVEHP